MRVCSDDHTCNAYSTTKPHTLSLQWPTTTGFSTNYLLYLRVQHRQLYRTPIGCSPLYMANQDVGMSSSSAPSSSHRLPTVSASQALQTLQAKGSCAVSTGIPQLDEALAPEALPGRVVSGGYPRGKVTEIFGPPGVGKTAFGRIQAAANALREGHRAIWVDAACSPLAPQRVNQVLSALTQPQPLTTVANAHAPSHVPQPSLDEFRNRFYHYTAPALAHLLALFVHKPASFPPPNTSLIVIDSLSTLFDNAYPRNADDRASKNKSEQARWAAGRRFAIINELISALTKVAALHDIALLITCQTITRIRVGSRALLVPAISGAEWDNGISTRMVLFRDWVTGQGESRLTDAAQPALLRSARFAGILKANGSTLANEGGVGEVVSFAIGSTGLCGMDITAVDIAAPDIALEANPLKRRFAEIDEHGNSTTSDELYGWVEDDDVAAEGLLFEEEPLSDIMDGAESGPRSAAKSETEYGAGSQGER
ncbi:unnamed protein product [Periconia digitata]|uniref:RecA family profile 1 domain-containing protein n=1 Tax=Periconia digitata TaxID=1303443 RepID=A0A9W4UJI9_9PLEO|nr:unnamed protein product [Periconia digitata]